MEENGVMIAVSVGILGASGAVGAEILKVLEERDFPLSDLKLFVAPDEVGGRVKFRTGELVYEGIDDESLDDLDILFVAVSGELSKEISPIAVKKGVIVIDNSSAYRMHPEVPLIIPEVNPGDIERHKGIIANPNCSTIIALLAVGPLHREKRIRHMIVSTYQAVSGAGAPAMKELENQVRAYIEGEPLEVKVFQHQIAFNVIPHINAFNEEGYTLEEMKLHEEARKILGDNELNITCTCVRVPVFRSHSESIYIEFDEDFSPDEARAILKGAEGLKLVDEPQNNLYPMPLDTSNQDLVYVGRIRQDVAKKNALSLWCAGDQLRKGAAVNAVQIAELLINR